MIMLLLTTGEAVEVTNVAGEPALQLLQDWVAGWIEVVYLPGGAHLVVNEEGKLKGLPTNMRATLLVQSCGINDVIAGNAVLLQGEHALRGDDADEEDND